MNFYFLDDDHNILNLLKIIVKERKLGEICGSETSPQDALEEIASLRPDILIVDFLMPEMDGVTFINQARQLIPDASYIMLSQVASKDMVASAYEAGIEFFISKPLNSIEVEAVIKKVQDHRLTAEKLQKVQDILHMDTAASVPAAVETDSSMTDAEHEKLVHVLQDLGMAGEKGSQDIIKIVEHLLSTGTLIGEQPFKQICSQFTDMPKSMEQRIRRAAATGLSNVAYMGLDDYGNPIFERYAAMIFGFEHVRREMDYISGKSDKHGVVKIRSFINAITNYCRH